MASIGMSLKEGDIVIVVDKEDDGEWSLHMCTSKPSIHRIVWVHSTLVEV